MTPPKTHLRPDEELAVRAQEIAEAEGISYGAALSAAGKRYPELLTKYMSGQRGRVQVTPPPGKTLVQTRASDDLAELAAALVAAHGISATEAQDLVLAENLPLRQRYRDEVTGADPFRELAELSAAAIAAGRASVFAAANSLVLAERPELARRVDAYFE